MTALVAGVFSPAASARTEDSPRRDYLSAMEAARNGNLARAKQFLPRLDGYVLRGYVEYELLKDRLALTPPDRIRAFLEENRDAPVSDIIRKKWLRQLASKGEWEAFLREYQDVENDPELQCQRLTQLLRPERATPPAPLMAEIEKLWLTGKPLPAACDAVFVAWKKSGHMTSEKVWERIRLAMENGQLGLAERSRALSRLFGTRLGHALAGDAPRSAARARSFALSRRDTGGARYRASRHRAHGAPRSRGGDATVAEAQEPPPLPRRGRELRAAPSRHRRGANHLPVALTWLANVSADASDETLHLWRVRAALRAGDWEAARGFVAGLTEEQRRQPQWRYWSARVLGLRPTRATTPGMEEVEQRREQLPGTAAVRRTRAQPRLLRFPRRRPAGRGLLGAARCHRR